MVLLTRLKYFRDSLSIALILASGAKRVQFPLTFIE